LCRRLFNLIAALSALLCIVTAALWFRSYGTFDRVKYLKSTDTSHAFHLLDSGAGYVEYEFMWMPWSGFRIEDSDPNRVIWRQSHEEPSPTHKRTSQFRYEYNNAERMRANPAYQYFFLVSVPYPALMICAVILPTIAIRVRHRANQQFLNGCCARCGYDLRATPDRCPECGTVVSPDSSS